MSAKRFWAATKVMYQGVEIDFSKGWKRMTMAEAVKEYAGIDFMALYAGRGTGGR